MFGVFLNAAIFLFLSQLWLFFFFMPFFQKKVRFPPPRQKICFKTFLIFLTTNDQNLPMNLSFPGNFFPIKSLVSFAFIWKLNETWQFSMNLPKMTYKDVLPYSCFMVKNKQKTNNLKNVFIIIWKRSKSFPVARRIVVACSDRLHICLRIYTFWNAKKCE